MGRKWSLDLNTGLWLVQSDHVTRIMALATLADNLYILFLKLDFIEPESQRRENSNSWIRYCSRKYPLLYDLVMDIRALAHPFLNLERDKIECTSLLQFELDSSERTRAHVSVESDHLILILSLWLVDIPSRQLMFNMCEWISRMCWWLQMWVFMAFMPSCNAPRNFKCVNNELLASQVVTWSFKLQTTHTSHALSLQGYTKHYSGCHMFDNSNLSNSRANTIEPQGFVSQDKYTGCFVPVQSVKANVVSH